MATGHLGICCGEGLNQSFRIYVSDFDLTHNCSYNDSFTEGLLIDLYNP